MNIPKVSAEWVRNGNIGEQGVLCRWSRGQKRNHKEGYTKLGVAQNLRNSVIRAVLEAKKESPSLKHGVPEADQRVMLPSSTVIQVLHCTY